MGIFGALAILIPLVTMAAIWEGFLYLCERARERREWKRLKAYYYPNGQAIRRLSEAEAIPADGWVYYPDEGEEAYESIGGM